MSRPLVTAGCCRHAQDNAGRVKIWVRRASPHPPAVLPRPSLPALSCVYLVAFAVEHQEASVKAPVRLLHQLATFAAAGGLWGKVGLEVL